MLLLGTILAAVPLAGPSFAASSQLAAYNVDISETSISGISSGAYMAVQFATAWSSIIKGVGVVAGGPYGCSEGSGATALSTCMGGSPPIDLSELVQQTGSWSSSGAIDDVGNIARQKIYVFTGYNDQVVARPVAEALRAFYAHYQDPRTGNLFYQTAIGAGHSLVTTDFGGKCSDNGGEYINKCGYDQAGIILQHVYGTLDPRNTGALTGKLLPFSQAEFTAPDAPADDSMDDTGFAYVPSACSLHEACRLHVVLHGCQQSVSDIGQDFVRHTGYNEWADTNHIIVLYPQTRSLGLANPQSCWDWWGYLDSDPTVSPTYLLKSGKQISAIKAMIDRVVHDAVIAIIPGSANPVAPTALVAPDRSDTAIDVVWSAVAGIASYDVFRAGPDDADFRQIGLAAGLSYADAGLTPATQYRYKVRASSTNGTDPFSPIISAATLKQVQPCDDPGRCPAY